MAQGTYITSPKKKKTCKTLILLGIFITIVGVALSSSIHLPGDVEAGLAFLGAIFSGACSFYIGRTKRGILYALTFGLVFIGAIIDLIKLSSGKLYDHNGYPIID